MNKKVIITPSIQRHLTILGEQIKLARLRRNISTTIIAERANISRPTLLKIEHGAPDVAIGLYARVLHAIGGMDEDLTLVCRDDITGRTFQDLGLKIRKRSKN